MTGMAHQSHWVKGWMLIAAFGLLGISPGYAGEGSGKGGPRVLPDGAGQPIPGRYIVLFKSNTDINERKVKIQRHGGIVRRTYKTVAAASAHLPNDRAVRDLSFDPAVLEVIPDREVYAFKKGGNGKKPGGGSEPSGQTVPAGVKRSGASPDDAVGYTGLGVGVAVMDTGLDYNHTDLQPVATECFTAYASCQDDDGHGTHVGGIIAARNNSQDVVGVAPDSTLYSVKVLNQNGSGSDSDVMEGFDWIALNANTVTPPIRVVNVSLGRPGSLDDNPALHALIQAVTDLGISVVVSAGNDASREVKDNIPAAYPEVFAIASTTAESGTNRCRFFSGTIQEDTGSYFTTDGPGVMISAPGEAREDIKKNCFIQSSGILSTRLGGGVTRKSGTSMSAPHVTGVAALAWQKALNEGIDLLSPTELRSIIQSSADLINVVPQDSPTTSYTFDGIREGVLWAPGVVEAVGSP